MCDADDAASSDDSVDWSLLQSRFAELKTAEADRYVQQMMQTATNWKEGRCEQRVLLVLEDWVRRLSVAQDQCVCGTHSGAVVLSDLESGEVLHRWVAPLGGGSEVTSVGFDGDHIISGDASGGVWLRRSAAARTAAPPMSGRHRSAVSGVHWPGGDRAYSCSTDRRFSAWTVPELSVAAGDEELGEEAAAAAAAEDEDEDEDEDEAEGEEAEAAAVPLKEAQALVVAKPIFAMGTCEGGWRAPAYPVQLGGLPWPQPLASTCSEDEPGPSQAHRCEGYAALGLANGQVVLRVHRGLIAAFSRGYYGAACQLRTRPPRERARAPPAPVP